jgi:hypothetical protein
MSINQLIAFIHNETIKRGPNLDIKKWWETVFEPILNKIDFLNKIQLTDELWRKVVKEIWPNLIRYPEMNIMPDGSKSIIKEVHVLAQICRLHQEPEVTLKQLCYLVIITAHLTYLMDKIKLLDWQIYCVINKSPQVNTSESVTEVVTDLVIELVTKFKKSIETHFGKQILLN